MAETYAFLLLNSHANSTFIIDNIYFIYWISYVFYVV